MKRKRSSLSIGLARFIGVSERGYFAWRGRPASPRQSRDLILLAHIRAQFKTSNDPMGHHACILNQMKMVVMLVAIVL